MHASLDRLPPVALPLLLAVAVLGYLAGTQRIGARRAAQAPAAALRVASRANVLLEYPAGWQQAAGGPAIPGLALEHPLFLSAGGSGSQAGLEAGVLPGAPAGPLPASLLGRLLGQPHVEVVSLAAIQALRYTDVSPAGYGQQLELYVVPSPLGSESVLACHAPAAGALLLRQCGQIAASLSLAGQATSDITPNPVYGARLGALVEALNGVRRQARRQMSGAVAPLQLAGLAGVLAGRFVLAAGRLARLEPPLVAGPAQVLLGRSMIAAGGAYRRLARAAGSHSVSGFERARSEVAVAEDAVGRALESFALLGYGRA